MPETWENCLGQLNSWIYYAGQTREIYQALSYSVDIKVNGKLRNPLSKTVLRKHSFIWNEGPVNIWNDPKDEMNLKITFKL